MQDDQSDSLKKLDDGETTVAEHDRTDAIISILK